MPSVSQTSRNTPPTHKSRGASFYAGINRQNPNNKRYPGPHSDSNSPNSRKNAKKIGRLSASVNFVKQTQSAFLFIVLKHLVQTYALSTLPLSLTSSTF